MKMFLGMGAVPSVLLLAGFMLSAAIAADKKNVTFDAVSPSQVRALGTGAKGLAAVSPGNYHIRLAAAPVVAYRGGLPGLKATDPAATGALKLDAKSPESRAYAAFLAEDHANVLQAIEGAIGRRPRVIHHLFHAINEMVLKLSVEEAERVRQLPGVLDVQAERIHQLHTDAGPGFIGASTIWTDPGYGTMGEGVIIGVIDTGINYSNPSFADLANHPGGDNYDHTNPWGSGTYAGVCDPAEPSYDPGFGCNDKLIGAWGHADAGIGSPVDDNGHGSHTASTAGGNFVDATVSGTGVSDTQRISGVAPHANLIMYDACAETGCPDTATTFAINQALLDGVDVINYSIGGASNNPWNNSVALAFKGARAAGIFVATSAGNSGPGAETMGSPADAPWLTTVGNSTHDRKYINDLTDMSGGDTTPPPDFAGQGFTGGYGPNSIVHARDFDAFPTDDPRDGQCLEAFPASTWTGGEIVVCDRGTIARVDKGQNVLDGGAGGFVLANSLANGESTNNDLHFLPAVHLGYTDAEVLRTWLAGGTGHVATIGGVHREIDPGFADIMAASSSRGANPSVPDIIKPDVSAPGSDILAAYGTGDAVDWAFLGGTSMSSPHVAGAAALLHNVHPTWTPAEIQSALMSTGVKPMQKETMMDPADPFDRGGGRVDVPGAVDAGLVLDETIPGYDAADPALGGDPKTLNLPSLGNHLCPGTCTWTRTVRSTTTNLVTWSSTVVNPPGWMLQVTPPSFDLAGKSTQVVTIQADATTLPGESWDFGEVVFQGAGHPDATFPVALAMAPAPPAELEGSYTVTDSASDPACDTGFGGYVDLESSNIFPNPGIFGDTIIWTAFGDGDPISYYGKDYAGMGFTDDGFAIADFSSNLGAPPWPPQTLPNVSQPNNIIGALWSDLEIVYNGTPGNIRGVSLAFTTDGRLIIAEYDDLQLPGTTDSIGDFEIVMSRAVDNTPGVPEIVLAFDNIATANLPAAATVGVENMAGDKASVFLDNADPAPKIASGLMVCFDYVPGPPVCADYLVLDSGDVTTAVVQEAVSGILAGDNYGVDDGGELYLNTSSGGNVQLYPGFSVVDKGILHVDINGAMCP